MLTQQTIQKILGIDEKVHMTKDEMIEKFSITFSPYSDKASQNIKEFEQKLKESFKRLKVDPIPYEDAWVDVSSLKRTRRFFKYILNNMMWFMRKALKMTEINFYIPFETIKVLAGPRRIKKGICVVCSGEQELKELQMQYIANFKDNSIITIIDFPGHIHESSTFEKHFDTAMGLFAHHMTNIILAVDKQKMMVYNFNASHPIYSLNDNEFDKHILETLIPKVVAPISPHRLNEFQILNKRFDPMDHVHKKIITEMQNGAKMFVDTKLYPAGKKIDSLAFRHNFHKLIGKLHLDNRSGMSFGFLAYQTPSTLSTIDTFYSFKAKYPHSFVGNDYFVNEKGDAHVLIKIQNHELVLQIPEVWVMTLRSGSDKTHFDPHSDLIKLGLKNGKMLMQFPKNLKISSVYKPSFDTKVILAHAIGNVLVASILEYLCKNNWFSKNIMENGSAISHWHGYFNKNYIPKGLTMYGAENLHVSCSSPQSAIYALKGKLSSFDEYIKSGNAIEYRGDIHIEPHHGINIIYPSLTGLADYILKNPEATQLGNKYLYS